MSYLNSELSMSSDQLPILVLWANLGPPDNCWGVKYIMIVVTYLFKIDFFDKMNTKANLDSQEI